MKISLPLLVVLISLLANYSLAINNYEELSCPHGYILASDYSCVKGEQQPGCVAHKLNNLYECKYCSSEYNQNWSTGACTCKNSGDIMVQDANGNAQCVPGTKLSQCYVHDSSDPSQCLKCENSYKLSNGQCIYGIGDCSHHIEIDGVTHCASCAWDQGYRTGFNGISQTGTCAIQQDRVDHDCMISEYWGNCLRYKERIIVYKHQDICRHSEKVFFNSTNECEFTKRIDNCLIHHDKDTCALCENNNQFGPNCFGGKICIPGHHKISGCMELAAPGQGCEVCDPGMVLIDQNCEQGTPLKNCKQHNYLYGQLSCNRCETGFRSQYDSQDRIFRCIDEFENSMNMDVKDSFECPVGSYQTDDFDCLAGEPMAGCLLHDRFDRTKCSKCFDDQSTSSSSGICSCQGTFLRDKDNKFECTTQNIPRIQNCYVYSKEDPSVCLQCEPNQTFLSDGTCGRNIDGCRFHHNSTVCESCFGGVGFTGGVNGQPGACNFDPAKAIDGCMVHDPNDISKCIMYREETYQNYWRSICPEGHVSTVLTPECHYYPEFEQEKQRCVFYYYPGGCQICKFNHPFETRYGKCNHNLIKIPNCWNQQGSNCVECYKGHFLQEDYTCGVGEPLPNCERHVIGDNTRCAV